MIDDLNAPTLNTDYPPSLLQERQQVRDNLKAAFDTVENAANGGSVASMQQIKDAAAAVARFKFSDAALTAAFAEMGGTQVGRRAVDSPPEDWATAQLNAPLGCVVATFLIWTTQGPTVLPVPGGWKQRPFEAAINEALKTASRAPDTIKPAKTEVLVSALQAFLVVIHRATTPLTSLLMPARSLPALTNTPGEGPRSTKKSATLTKEFSSAMEAAIFSYATLLAKGPCPAEEFMASEDRIVLPTRGAVEQLCALTKTTSFWPYCFKLLAAISALNKDQRKAVRTRLEETRPRIGRLIGRFFAPDSSEHPFGPDPESIHNAGAFLRVSRPAKSSTAHTHSCTAGVSATMECVPIDVKLGWTQQDCDAFTAQKKKTRSAPCTLTVEGGIIVVDVLPNGKPEAHIAHKSPLVNLRNCDKTYDHCGVPAAGSMLLRTLADKDAGFKTAADAGFSRLLKGECNLDDLRRELADVLTSNDRTEITGMKQRLLCALTTDHPTP